jgi:hypothetical protein
MAKTVWISKSKALNFKKLSFLYLIFIVFFFFSSSGDYVKHFKPLSETQELLNLKLKAQLDNYKPILKDEQIIKQSTIDLINVIEDFISKYRKFDLNGGLKGEKIKEQKFSKQYLNTDSATFSLHVALCNFIRCFPKGYQGNLAVDLGVLPEKIELNEPIKNQYLKEVPNGAVGSILSHLEMVALSQSLKYFKQEIEEGGMIRVSSSKDSTFLQGFKSVYYVGEKIDFHFFSRDSVAPNISINQVSMTPSHRDRHYKMSWTPTIEGTYELEANIGDEYIRHSLKVIKPSLRFLESEQEIAAFLSEPLFLTVDMNGLENIRGIRFSSNGAKIETNKNQLKIIPLFEGRFTIEMYIGNNLLDTRSLFAIKGKPPIILLKDIAGKSADLGKAHCLESSSPFWQVINFNVTIISPDGTSKELKSQTRFIRNEIRTFENNAEPGSTILFNQIRLLNANGVSTMMGAPIFIGK